jgi:formylmethanofuran dehydrogenase subunit B
VAVSIGDWIGGCVDTTTSVCHGPSGIAFQDVGEVTCTLGEIKNRGDLIIFWGSNPAESHPRHFTKYSLTPKGTFVPRGRKDRYCVLVDVRKTKSAKAADLFIQIKPRADFEALWALRAIAKGVQLDAAVIEAETGVPLATWQGLMDRMKQAKYGVILFGMGLTMTRGKHLNSYALLALVSNFTQAAREHLARIPSIVLDPKDTPTTRVASVVFHTATYGINTAGTVYRMDDVPIPLRPAFESPLPTDEEVLRRIERRVRELKAAQPS